MGSRYKEMGVRTASREQLVVMMYEGAMQQARRAKAFHAEGKAGLRGAALSRALAIVGELQHALDLEAGGEIARNLQSLYFFVTDRLLEANVTNRIEAVDEALHVLEPLHEAWAEIARGGAAAAANAQAMAGR